MLRHIAFMRNILLFNGFNQTAIVLRYSAYIKPRKRLKPLKQKTLPINTIWRVRLRLFSD